MLPDTQLERLWAAPAETVAAAVVTAVIGDLLRGQVEGLSEEGKVNVAFVPLGTPLLPGPGAIAAIMVFMREADTAASASGCAGAGRCAGGAVADPAVRGRGQAAARQAGIELVTRISGLLTAFAVQLVADAVREFIREGA
jgi:multiple antibiotic resistance protein